MDLDDNSVCDTPGPPVFILPPSQEESQSAGNGDDDVMREMLRKLPALQPPYPQVQQPHIREGTTLGQGTAHWLDEPSTEAAVTKAQAHVLVPDSEYETSHKPAFPGDNDPSDVVSESEDVSDSKAEITVIEKRIQTDSDIIADTEPDEPEISHRSVTDQYPAPATKPSTPNSSSTPSNESSFQSKNRSNLGSYDQCELYTTQEGHAHGYRFNLFPSSQEDMFTDHHRSIAGNGDSNGDTNGLVSTPSEHIGSLQFSGAPMLVPETVDETENEISPSPDVYGSTPLIIPSSPSPMDTETQVDEEDTVYDVNAANTMADYSKDSSEMSEGPPDNGDSMEVDDIEHNRAASLPVNLQLGSLQDFSAALAIPTLVDNNVPVTKPTSQQYVADIHAAGVHTPDRQSESLRLHLTESHPQVSGFPPEVSDTHGQLEVSPETEKGPPVLELVPETPRKRPQAKACNGERGVEDIGSVRAVSTPHDTGSVEIVSQHNGSGPHDVIVINSNSGEHDDECEDLFLRLSPSQSMSESGRSRSARSQRDVTSGHRDPGLFHLTLPKDGTLLHPVQDVSMATKDTDVSVATNGAHSEGAGEQGEEASAISEPCSPIHSPTLTLGMIQSELEPTTQPPEFRLERPEVGDVTADQPDDVETDMFRRTGGQQARPHTRYVLDDSSDDDDYLATKPRPETMAPSGGIEEIKGDDSRSPTLDDLGTTEHTTEVKERESRSQGHVELPRSRSQSQVEDSEQLQKRANIEETVEDTLPYDPQDVASLQQNGAMYVAVDTGPHLPLYRKDSTENGDLSAAVERQLKRADTPRSRRDSGDSVSSHGSVGRQMAMDRRSPKSPKEIQSIIKAYSHILSKGKHAKSVEQRRGSEDATGKSPTGSTAKLSPKKHDSQGMERRGSQSSESGFVAKLARSLSTCSQPELSKSPSVPGRASQTDLHSMAAVHRSASVDHRRGSQDTQKHDSQSLGKHPRPVTIATRPSSEDLQRRGSETKLSGSSNVELKQIPEDLASTPQTSIMPMLANSADPDEPARNEPSHQDLHHLQITSSQNKELQTAVINIGMKSDTQPVGSPSAKPAMWMSARKPVGIPSDISDVTGSEVATQMASPACTQPGGITGLSQDMAAIKGTGAPVSICGVGSLVVHRTILETIDDDYSVHTRLTGAASEAGHSRLEEEHIITKSSRASSVSNQNQSIFSSPTQSQSQTTRVTYSSRTGDGINVTSKQTIPKAPNLAQIPVPYTDTSMQDENHNFPPVNKTKNGNPENRVTLTETSSMVVNGKPIDEKTVTPAVSTQSAKRMSTRSRKLRQKAKKLPSSAERNRLRGSKDCTPSPQTTSGSFIASTQTFQGHAGAVGSESSPGVDPIHVQKEHQPGDPFTFHGSQSQVATANVEKGGTPRRRTPVRSTRVSSSPDKTPLSSYKRKRLQHRKSGLKKPRVDKDGETAPKSTSKHHVWFQSAKSPSAHDLPISQQSDITSTTTGSLQSMPSSISQSSPLLDPVVSPSSSSSRLSGDVRTSVRARLSIDQSQPDTLQLHNSEDESYQKVTIVTRITKSYTVQTKTEREVIGPQGQVLEKDIKIEDGKPVVMEEQTYKKMQVVYMPSPSRSITSLTSGDLADISSSLSRSSGSMGSKVSMTSASLESGVSGSLDVQTGSLDHSDSLTGKSGAVGRSLNSDTSESDKIPSAQPPPSHTEIRAITPEARTTTPLFTDNDASDVVTPLGSSINKTGSYLHSRTVSMESPKTSESLFSTPEEAKDGTGGRRGSGQSRVSAEGNLGVRVCRPSVTNTVSEPRPSTSKLSPSEKPSSHTSSSDQISPEIPPQVQTISSSSPDDGKDLVASSGLPGSRIIARWKDGFYYPGMVKTVADARNKCLVKFDDGDKMAVKISDILLINRLPIGQSVMVLTDNGDFESGMVVRQQTGHYVVEADSGKTGRYPSGQVILTADQASCLITDKGREIMMVAGLPHGPTHVGDVSLENLMEGPRRSATKSVPVKDEDKDQGSRCRKRRIDAIKPQYTSTPTPKGMKQETMEKKRKAMAVEESPVCGLQSSPASTRRSPRKAKVGLFGKQTAPLPSKKIFKDMCFLLTNVDKSEEQRQQERQLLKDSSLETSTDESTVEDEMAEPFKKDNMKSQIEAGGGVVLDSINQKQVEPSKKMFLISSAYQRTFKYLQCLAQGIPCLSHMWLVDSAAQGRLLDHKAYVLPAGISLERKRIIERKSSASALMGLKGIVNSQNAEFCAAWTDILQLASCNVLPKLLYAQLDVIITDSTCTLTVIRQARSHDVPLVSSEWVIQSLVNGKPMKYDGHVRYQHDFVLPVC